MQINKLPTRDVPAASDLLATYSSTHGDTRKLPLSALVTWIKSAIETDRPCGWEYQELDGAGVFAFATPTPSEEHIHVHVLANDNAAVYVATFPGHDDSFDGQNILFTIEGYDNGSLPFLSVNPTPGVTSDPVIVPDMSAFMKAQYQYDAPKRTWFLVAR